MHYRSSERAGASALAAELPDAFAVRADLAVPAEVDALVGGAQGAAPAASTCSSTTPA